MSAREGVDILVNDGVVSTMIKVFLEITAKPHKSQCVFFIYLLEAFDNILQFDEGINVFLNTGIIKRINEILLDQSNNIFILHYKSRANPL